MTRALLRRDAPFPWFEVTDQAKVIFETRDLPGQDQADAAVARCATEPFTLFDPPLLRFLLIRQDSERHIFTLSVHHLLMDGWSLISAFNEIAAIMDALVGGTDLDLPDPVDYAEVLADEAAYAGLRAVPPTRRSGWTIWRLFRPNRCSNSVPDRLTDRTGPVMFRFRYRACCSTDCWRWVASAVPVQARPSWPG